MPGLTPRMKSGDSGRPEVQAERARMASKNTRAAMGLVINDAIQTYVKTTREAADKAADARMTTSTVNFDLTEYVDRILQIIEDDGR
jgi:hypothetical protein